MTTRPTALEAAALYVVLTLAMTWPLVTDLGGSLPGDLGDSLLNGYILSWGEKHLVALLGGDPGAFAGWWQANIFHPAPYALAYSEHLFTEVVMALPVWVATHNVILAYNVVFLASLALSGLGMFLLVRELTKSAVAAWLAGLAFAFLPYRLSQIPHLQVMSSEWMPWTIYAFRRYFETRRPAALAGALAALVAQQLACGYFLIYFTPFVAFYLVWEITARARWHDARLLATLAALLLIDAVIVWPFLFPYLELRRLGFPPRTLEELVAFSADVRGYVTAPLINRLWGASVGLTPWLRPENELFAGAVLYVAAAMGSLEYARTRWRESAGLTAPTAARRQTLYALGGISCILCVALGFIVWTGGVRTGWLSLRDADRLVIPLAMTVGGLLVLSPRLRSVLRITSDLRPWAFAVVVIAWTLSLGPMPRSGGRALDITAPYLFLFEHVPGVDGLRVPARLAMLVCFGLAVLAGYGLAAIERSRNVAPWGMAIGLAILAETAVAVPLNGALADAGTLLPPSKVQSEASAPRVYHYLAGLPPGTVVAELPFGYPSWELRYVFYASVHQQRLLNGYSGGFPARYVQTANLLQRPLTRPDEAWRCLLANGVTTVVVHRSAYPNPAEADAVIDWVRAHGGTLMTTMAEAEVLQVPAASTSGVK